MKAPTRYQLDLYFFSSVVFYLNKLYLGVPWATGLGYMTLSTAALVGNHVHVCCIVFFN